MIRGLGMRARGSLFGGAALICLLLGGCGDTGNYLDPYQKPYAWHPTGAPTADIAAQLVDPRDLVVGRGAQEGDAKQATLAISHIWLDQPKSFTPTTSGATTGAGAAPSASAATGGSN